MRALHWNDVQILFEHLKASGSKMKALFGFGKKIEELDTLSKFKGCLFGCAIGDALGAPTEFLSVESIKQRYGYVEEPLPWGSHKAGCWTDDTEMTLYLSYALLECEDLLDMDAVMQSVTKLWARWYDEHDGSRAPGGTCLGGARKLRDGVHWKESGKPNGNGCGTVMRVHPVGLLYAKHPELLKQVAWNQGFATHQGERTNEGAVLCAYMIGRLFLGDAWQDVVADVRELVKVPSLKAMVELALDPEVPIETKLDKLRGWDGGEAFAAALACFVEFPNDFEAAVRRAVNSPGDSDSLGCITGALAGAHLGIEAIPARWLEQVEGRAELEDVSLRLHRAYRALSA